MRQYLDQLQYILDNGNTRDDRTGTGTIGVFGLQARYDLSTSFPAVTTKKLYWKGVVHELLWFLKGDTNIKYLVDNGVHIWDDDYKRWNLSKNIDDGDMGFIYPRQWRKWGSDVIYKTQQKPKIELSFKPLSPNLNAPSKYVGKTIKSMSCGSFMVIDYSKENKFTIQFLGSNSVLYGISSNNVKTGCVKDPYLPKIKGVGCVGVDKKTLPNSIRRKLYTTWTNMLDRCYNKDHMSYHNYGGKGVSVSNRWLCFEYFAEDVVTIDGWDEKVNDWKSYHLDKDMIGNKFLYSKNNCVWIHKNDNLARLDRKIFYTFKNKKTKETYRTNNVVSLAREFNLDQKKFNSIGSLLANKKIKSYRGWELVKTEDLTNNGIDQIAELIGGIKNNPYSRRHILSSWNVGEIDQMSLPPCHCMAQFYVNNGKLSCQMYQRSGDFALGVPFNVASYALLTHMIAQVCGLEAHEFIHTLGDGHIYLDHVEQVKEQLKREPLDLPQLELNPDIKNIDDFKYEDIKLVGYKSHSPIKYNLSTGVSRRQDES
jgi:thymidylate synthase